MAGNWGHRVMQNYLNLTRLDKFPLGTLVIFWPAAFGIAMAAYAFDLPAHEFGRKVPGFAVSATLLHSTFCILNDICDRDFDGKVERTKTRPLVSGQATVLEAWLYFWVSLGALFFTMSYNKPTPEAITLGLLAIPLHFVYPLSKRWTRWPQAMLGISNSTSCLIGWYTVAGSRGTRAHHLAALSLYLSCVCWTIHFDTVYAVQDKDDDARLGLYSTALLFGERVRTITSCFAAAAVACLAISGALTDRGGAFFALSCGGAAAHFYWQMRGWDIHDRKRAGQIFKSNGNLGYIIFAGMVLDYLGKGS